MGWLFERWATPQDRLPPTECLEHPGTSTVAMMACNHPMAGKETVWAQQVCPRCAFLDRDGIFFELMASWDGAAWEADDDVAGSLFRTAWLEQARGEGIVPVGLPADVVDDSGVRGLGEVWAFRVLHPHLSADEAWVLLASTGIARRPGHTPDEYAPLARVPYTDLAALQEMSSRLVDRWIRYHEALAPLLPREALDRLVEENWRRQFDPYAVLPWEDQSAVPDEEREARARFAASIIAAHQAVVASGVEAPHRTERWQVRGDVTGQLEVDVAGGLHAWLNDEPSWMAAARRLRQAKRSDTGGKGDSGAPSLQ